MLSDWSKKHVVGLNFIQPGKPAQNEHIKRFNRTYREEFLALDIFSNLAGVREITEDFIKEYNEYRAHEPLGKQSPYTFSRYRAGASPLAQSLSL